MPHADHHKPVDTKTPVLVYRDFVAADQIISVSWKPEIYHILLTDRKITT